LHNSSDTAYRVSKKLAERAARDFVAREKPSFDLATICPSLILDPPLQHLPSLDKINTSNQRIVDLLQGKWKDRIPEAYIAGAFWIDVRDLAIAHILAMENLDAGGRRLLPVSHQFSNRQIADAVWKNFPELRDRLPGPEVPGGEMAPPDKIYKIDNSMTVNFLGIEFRKLEGTVTDIVHRLKPYL
jgi:nucleoside-diphosphate-sugar epimerase